MARLSQEAQELSHHHHRQRLKWGIGTPKKAPSFLVSL
jgi:hypothetical protein